MPPPRLFDNYYDNFTPHFRENSVFDRRRRPITFICQNYMHLNFWQNYYNTIPSVSLWQQQQSFLGSNFHDSSLYPNWFYDYPKRDPYELSNDDQVNHFFRKLPSSSNFCFISYIIGKCWYSIFKPLTSCDSFMKKTMVNRTCRLTIAQETIAVPHLYMAVPKKSPFVVELNKGISPVTKISCKEDINLRRKDFHNLILSWCCIFVDHDLSYTQIN